MTTQSWQELCWDLLPQADGEVAMGELSEASDTGWTAAEAVKRNERRTSAVTSENPQRSQFDLTF